MRDISWVGVEYEELGGESSIVISKDVLRALVGVKGEIKCV